MQTSDIAPKHPACILDRNDPERLAFVHALTAPFFEDKKNPPLRVVDVDRVADGVGKRRSDADEAHPRWRILCDVPLSADDTLCPQVAFIVKHDAASFTQEMLMRPYHRNVAFWESIERIEFRRMVNLNNLAVAVLHFDSFASVMTDVCTQEQVRPEVIRALDLLLTLIIEVNRKQSPNPTWWNVGFCLPHMWLAHAAKFAIGESGYGSPRHRLCSIQWTWQGGDFFKRVRRLLTAFSLNALPITAVEMCFQNVFFSGSTSRYPVESDFQGILADVTAVYADAAFHPWSDLAALLTSNFPKLNALTLRPHIGPSWDYGPILRFLVRHNNTVTFAYSRHPGDVFPRIDYVRNYVERARGMRALVEADAVALRPHSNDVKVAALDFFRSRLFEPHVVHLIDRFLHGRRSTLTSFGFDSPAGELSVRLDQ
jgi:hypothetical protein